MSKFRFFEFHLSHFQYPVYECYILSLKDNKNSYRPYIFSGYIIPQGWKVLTWSRAIHKDPIYYPSPDEFNPSRWDVSYINY